MLSYASLGIPTALGDEHAKGCVDAYTQAQQLRNARKFVEARSALRVCVQTSCSEFIVKDCTRWLDEVQTSLPSVVPAATDDAGNDVPGVAVSMDGAVLTEHIEGRSIEIDPGPHTFTFTTSDGKKVNKQLVVSEGEKDKRVVAVFEKPESAAPAASPAAPAATAPTGEREHAAPPWRTVALVTAGLGVIGLGVGSALGIEALSGKSSAGCADENGQTVCHNSGTLASAQQSGNLSTAFFVAGGVLTAAGLVAWFALPHGTTVGAGATASTNGAGLTIRGSF